MELVGTKRRLDLTQPVVMAVVNVTPDSFFDGGRFHRAAPASGAPPITPAGARSAAKLDLGLIYEQAQQMLADGAAILDIGGESSRPGAEPVSEAEELKRVMPVIERLSDLDTMLSVDTYKPAVAAAAIASGCHLINDITGGADRKMRELVARSGAAICLMHKQGIPRSMQDAPRYDDVCAEVGGYLQQQVALARRDGVPDHSLVVDPGFGFGKRLEHNLALLGQLTELGLESIPVLAGLSRKSMLLELTGRQVDERLAGSLALATLAARHGARIVRAHDIAATVDAVKVGFALRQVQEKTKGVGRS